MDFHETQRKYRLKKFKFFVSILLKLFVLILTLIIGWRIGASDNDVLLLENEKLSKKFEIVKADLEQKLISTKIKLKEANHALSIKNIREGSNYGLEAKKVLSAALAKGVNEKIITNHLRALSKLGAKYKIIDGYVHASSGKKLKSSNIKFSKISVGATENLIIASSMAKGTSILSNCAIEPEIKDLVNFINSIGGKIKWIGKRKLRVIGVNNFKETKYTIMPDRIEAGTYIIAAAVTNGKLNINGIDPKIIRTEIDILKKIGVKIKTHKQIIKVLGTKNVKNINLKTAPYPGFPTDLQAQLMVLLCKSKKNSTIVEEIFENRFMHVSELNRMGANIKTKGNMAYIEGNTNFKAAELMATDLRASVSLILAALSAKGKSIINRIYHLDRGYELIERKMNKIGAKIRRIS